MTREPSSASTPIRSGWRRRRRIRERLAWERCAGRDGDTGGRGQSQELAAVEMRSSPDPRRQHFVHAPFPFLPGGLDEPHPAPVTRKFLLMNVRRTVDGVNNAHEQLSGHPAKEAAVETPKDDVWSRLDVWVAGAIIIGETNVPEFDAWPWTSSSTWGITRDPWNTERTPGGSSGGSATAAANGMCGVAVGSDGGGSVRYQPRLTGLVGFKPQRVRIPLDVQHADGWHGLVTYGSLNRTSPTQRCCSTPPLAPAPTSGSSTNSTLVCHRCASVVSFDPPPGSLTHLSPSPCRRTTLRTTRSNSREARSTPAVWCGSAGH